MGERENEDVYAKQYGVGDLICESCHLKIDPAEDHNNIVKISIKGNTGTLESRFYHKNGICDIGK